MKILYISTVFPRASESSTIYTDLAEELHKRGHEIFVVVAEEKRKIKSTQLEHERGFPVLRVKVGNLYDVSLIEKGITVLSIKAKLKKAIKEKLTGRNFDFILFEAPPVNTADVVEWAKEHFGCSSYLMLKDIFPQNGVDIGIIRKGGLIHRYFKRKEELLYQTADTIGCMSEANRNYILKHNSWLEKEKTEIFPNTKRIRTKEDKPKDYIMRRKYSIPEEAVVAVYGGNMGKPQGVDFLMDIIAKCKDRKGKDLFFLLVGRGTERRAMQEAIVREGLGNVLMLDALPREDYERMLTECDFGLIFLDKRFTIPNFPSRVLSYFEYGMPVLAATDTVTDFGKMLEEAGAGFWIPAGDIDSFLEKLDIIVSDCDLRHDMGEAGRKYLEQNYTVEKSCELLEARFSR